MKTFSAALLAGFLALAANAGAENLVLFSATAVAPDAWTWEDARVALPEGKLLITQHVPAAKLGDVFFQDHFAWHPEGTVEINTERVIAGDYALQILAYGGGKFLGYVDLFKGSKKIGNQVFRLGSIALPPNTDSIAFKIWVSHGGSVLIKDLKYYIPAVSDGIVFDRIVDASATGEVDSTTWTPADAGGTLTLNEGATFGSVLFPDRIAMPAAGVLIVQASGVQKGTLTAQLVTYDADGTFLSAVNAAERMVGGLSARLDRIEWPPGAVTFSVKVWIGGVPGCSAVVKRVLVIQ